MILGFVLVCIFCIFCSAIFPFASLNNNCFLLAISCNRINKNYEKQAEARDTSLLLNPSLNLVLLFNHYNNTKLGMNDDPDNVVNFKPYSINEIQSLKTANQNKSFSTFHINVCTLNKISADL